MVIFSYYFHNRNFKIYDWADGDFNTFFELFAAGQLGFGDYFDHLLSWLPRIYDDNVLFLKYEDMVEDLESAVVKIGSSRVRLACGTKRSVRSRAGCAIVKFGRAAAAAVV